MRYTWRQSPLPALLVSSGVHIGKVCWVDVMGRWILLSGIGKVAGNVLSLANVLTKKKNDKY